MPFFTSPTSSINLPPVPHPSPAHTSIAMSRSDSRDSTRSSTSVFSDNSQDTYYYSTSPSSTWDIRPRSSGSMSYALGERRDSASSITSSSSPQNQGLTSWLPSPYHSCQLMRSGSFNGESSSYISDDDLLFLSSPTASSSPVSDLQQTPTSIPTAPQEQKERELTTEEQIEIIRAQRERDDSLAQIRALHQRKALAAQQAQRHVRFAGEMMERRPSSGTAASGSGPVVVARRPSNGLKRRTVAVRRNLALVA